MTKINPTDYYVFEIKLLVVALQRQIFSAVSKAFSQSSATTSKIYTFV